MDQQPNTQSSGESTPSNNTFFEVYKVAIDDLHHTKSLGQSIDSFYLTIITLLLTADAYELATSKFDNWVPVVATAGVAVIGLAVTARWLQGARNLYQITENRYSWLRDVEYRMAHPELGEMSPNIFTQEYEAVYDSQVAEKSRAKTSALQNLKQAEPRRTRFYRRTLSLQVLCLLIFLAVPVILAVVTGLTLNSSALQQILSGK